MREYRKQIQESVKKKKYISLKMREKTTENKIFLMKFSNKEKVLREESIN